MGQVGRRRSELWVGEKHDQDTDRDVHEDNDDSCDGRLAGCGHEGGLWSRRWIRLCRWIGSRLGSRLRGRCKWLGSRAAYHLRVCANYHGVDQTLRLRRERADPLEQIRELFVRKVRRRHGTLESWNAVARSLHTNDAPSHAEGVRGDERTDERTKICGSPFTSGNPVPAAGPLSVVGCCGMCCGQAAGARQRRIRRQLRFTTHRTFIYDASTPRRWTPQSSAAAARRPRPRPHPPPPPSAPPRRVTEEDSPEGGRRVGRTSRRRPSGRRAAAVGPPKVC